MQTNVPSWGAPFATPFPLFLILSHSSYCTRAFKESFNGFIINYLQGFHVHKNLVGSALSASDN